MMDSNGELLKLLTDFGLTPTEALVYCAAASLGGGSTKEISVASGKERAQTHHALLRLQQLGVVQSAAEVPVKFKPMGIREAVDHLYSLQSMKLQRLKDHRAKLVEEFNLSRSRAMMPVETYSIIKGRANTYLKMIEAIQSSEKEVLLIMSIKGLTRLLSFRNFYRIVKSRARRGVQFKVISEITPDNLQDAKILSRISELRHIKHQITNASIYDTKIGSVALSLIEDLTLDAKDHIALWTTTQSFISTLRNFFDSVWFLAEPAESRIRVVGSDNAQVREIL
jgi:sugar-specific transcriptional regulator TrmB